MGVRNREKYVLKSHCNELHNKKNKRIESKPVSRAAAKPSGGNYKKISEVKNVVLADGSDLKTGSIVEHGKFGRGEVVTLDGTGGNQKAEIRFDSGETKKLLLQFAKLKIIE